MNKHLLEVEVQAYIASHIRADAHQIALAKSPFENVSAAELAMQIKAKQRAQKKLPTWFSGENIYFPQSLCIEQSSSEETALYKSKICNGKRMIDLTAGFGVDSFYFAQGFEQVLSCELDSTLAQISAHNALQLGCKRIEVYNQDGLDVLEKEVGQLDLIYADPLRRKNTAKVFRLADCSPNVVTVLPSLLRKAKHILLKTSPLLDIQAGLSELSNVKEIHIVSVKNECKELLWLIEAAYLGEPKVICAAINESTKRLELRLKDLENCTFSPEISEELFLYEPDVALLKSGAFSAIATTFQLDKLAKQSHLYTSNIFKPGFPGRIFQIEKVFAINELKKQRNLTGNVISRNYPDKPENLIKKFKISTAERQFVVFTKHLDRPIAIQAKLLQYY
jgi:hypothetical protein